MQKIIKCIENGKKGFKKTGDKLKKWASNLFKPHITNSKPTKHISNINVLVDTSKKGNTQTINNNISIGFIIVFSILIFAIICVCFVFIYAMTK